MSAASGSQLAGPPSTLFLNGKSAALVLDYSCASFSVSMEARGCVNCAEIASFSVLISLDSPALLIDSIMSLPAYLGFI